MDKLRDKFIHHFYFIWKHWILILFLILTGIGSALLEGLGISFIFPLLEGVQSAPHMPFPFNKITSWFSDYSLAERLQIIAVFLVVIVMMKGVFKYANIVATCQMRIISEKHFKILCFEQLLKVGIGYFNNEKIGRLHTICIVYSLYLGMFISFIGTSIPLFFNISIYLIMVMVLSSKMALISIVLSTIASIALYRIMRKATIVGKAHTKATENISSTLFELLSAMKIIRIFSREKETTDQFENEVDRYNSSVFQVTKVTGSVSPLYEFTGVLVLAAIMIIGSVLFFKIDGPGLSGVLGFLVIFQRISSSAMAINNLRVRIKGDMPGYLEVFRFLDAEDKQYLDDGNHYLSQLKDGIEFRNIEFRYNIQNLPVLKTVSFYISKGTKVGVVGTSGSGKSTLIELFLRFYDPQQGEILVDGIDLKELSIESWRKKVGVVSQDVFLFNDTLKNNIAYGNPEANQNEIEVVARKAYAHEFIQELPQGYNTLVGDRGVLLSGGQKQRIAIARAILINPEILIFDEATSSLDTESEKMVQNALDEVGEGRTVITIAHRLSTIIDSDKIIVMDSGKIVEEGTHQELIKLEGNYHKLIQLQGVFQG